MMPRLIFYFLLFLWVLTPLKGQALSHPPDPAGQGGGALQQEKDLIRDKRDALRQEVQEKRDAIREDLRGTRETFQKSIQEVKEKRTELFKEVREKREVLRNEVAGRREEFRSEAQLRREELKKKLGERRAERVENFFNKMVERFQAALERLRGFASRIEERIDIAEVKGKDVAALRSKLESARDRIAEAEKVFEDAKAKYTEAVKDPNIRVAFIRVKNIIQDVKSKIKTVHISLVEVVNSLKGLGEGSQTGTTSPTTP